MLQPGQPAERPRIVGLPLVYRETTGLSEWKMRVTVIRSDPNAPGSETIAITQEVADAILNGPRPASDQPSTQADLAYRKQVQEKMAELAKNPAQAGSLEELLSAPSDKKKPMKEWQAPAEKMRARLEKARQVAEQALGAQQNLADALGAKAREIEQAQFVTGAATLSQRPGAGAVFGQVRERQVGESTATLVGVPYREEPRALSVEVQQTLQRLIERAQDRQRPELLQILEHFKSVDAPERVWGDAKNRAILGFVRDFLLEVDQSQASQRGRLANQMSIYHNLENPDEMRQDPAYRLWYVARWADLLGERAKTKGVLLGSHVSTKRAENLAQLSRERSTVKGQKARQMLTQSKEIQIQASQAPRELGGEVQELVNRARGSFVTQLQRPGELATDTFVVSHRYDPESADSGEPSALMATAPSSLGKQRAVLTSARQVLDVESGHSILAHGRLNTADRWLDAQAFMLSELYEDPRTAPLATKVFIEGVNASEKQAIEYQLRQMPLPTGLSWKMKSNGTELDWERRGEVWKPKLDVAFLDLNLMTAGPGGKDAGDQPEWAPAAALWNRGEKFKAVALVLGRMLGLGLPYLVELGIAQFLAEQRWSEQEAAIGQLMHGIELEILGIPARLHTMSMTRAFNVFGEKGPLRSVLGIKGQEKRLSQEAQRLFKERLDQKLGSLQREERDLRSLMRRQDSEVKKEYLRLIGSSKPADRIRCDALFHYLRSSKAERESKLAAFETQRARLEGMWDAAFGEQTEDLPETQVVALIELSKELNVRIGAHCKSGKDRTGNFVAIYIATRQYFKSHPQPENPDDEKWKKPEAWAEYFRSIPAQPLFHANADVVDQTLNQQQADMMQLNRTLDRAPVAGRITGGSKVPPKAPQTYRWVADSEGIAEARVRQQLQE